MKLKVVGIDPSLRNFGVVKAELDLSTMELTPTKMYLVKTEDDAKKAKTVRKNSDDLRRARLLHDGFVEACADASFAFVEVPVGSQSARAMASYGVCIGVLSACPIAMIQLTPTETKLAGTGIKTATKDEMIEAAVAKHPNAGWLTRKVKGEVSFVGDNEHLADALFTIYAGMKTDEFKSVIAMKRHLMQV